MVLRQAAPYLAGMTQVHGHRGGEGPWPENTVPAFTGSMATGCHGLELDVVLTGDGEVLVSHEPWMDARSCLAPDGRRISDAEGREANIFRMSLEEAQRWACLPQADAPYKLPQVPKPTLAEVVHAVRAEAERTGRSVPKLIIEVKSEAGHYGIYQPLPTVLAQAVHRQVEALGIAENGIVQSFDHAVLEHMHALAPALPLALLAEEKVADGKEFARLGFVPAYYGPMHVHVDERLLARLRDQGAGVLAWTVNGANEMRRCIAMGVEGLITDRPALAMRLLAKAH